MRRFLQKISKIWLPVLAVGIIAMQSLAADHARMGEVRPEANVKADTVI